MEDIVKVASNYFDNLLSARPCDQMDKCLDAVSCKVTPGMQNILSSEFNAEDISVCLFPKIKHPCLTMFPIVF